MLQSIAGIPLAYIFIEWAARAGTLWGPNRLLLMVKSENSFKIMALRFCWRSFASFLYAEKSIADDKITWIISQRFQ